MRQRVLCLMSAPGRALPNLAEALRADGLHAMHRGLDTPIGAIALLQPDVVVVDGSRQLPAALSSCREVVRHLALPVLMLVASHSEAVELLCLGAGARQVVSTDARSRLLLARLHAVAPLRVVDPEELRVGPLVLVPAAQHLSCHGRAVPLSRTEAVLLEALMERPRQVLPRATLIRLAWEDPCSDRALESTLSRLRGKVLGAGGPRVAVPVRGVGYRLGIDPGGRR